MQFIRILSAIILALSFMMITSIANGQALESKIVYKSDNLLVSQISEHCFVHTSYLQTKDYGVVACNGIVLSNEGETIIFDTPADNKSSDELIDWISKYLNCKINAVIPTHFHEDCLGGLEAFYNRGIPSYSNFMTIQLAKEHNYVAPENGFNDSIVLKIGKQEVIAKYFGERHTKDNIIGYYPAENIMFGGCLIKELNANKGYLGDASIDKWSQTVERVKNKFPKVKIVVPGHGNYGNIKLLDYTIKLFHSN